MKGLFIAVLIFGTWLLASLDIMVTVGILHSWWHFIPVMGHNKASALALVIVTFACVAGALKVVGSIILGD